MANAKRTTDQMRKDKLKKIDQYMRKARKDKDKQKYIENSYNCVENIEEN